MPTEIPVTVPAKAERHVRTVIIDLPVRGPITLQAGFAAATFDEDGAQLAEVPDGAVMATQEEVMALPSSPSFYKELSAFLHSKRNGQ